MRLAGSFSNQPQRDQRHQQETSPQVDRRDDQWLECRAPCCGRPARQLTKPLPLSCSSPLSHCLSKHPLGRHVTRIQNMIASASQQIFKMKQPPRPAHERETATLGRQCKSTTNTTKPQVVVTTAAAADTLWPSDSISRCCSSMLAKSSSFAHHAADQIFKLHSSSGTQVISFRASGRPTPPFDIQSAAPGVSQTRPNTRRISATNDNDAHSYEHHDTADRLVSLIQSHNINKMKCQPATTNGSTSKLQFNTKEFNPQENDQIIAKRYRSAQSSISLSSKQSHRKRGECSKFFVLFSIFLLHEILSIISIQLNHINDQSSHQHLHHSDSRERSCLPLESLAWSSSSSKERIVENCDNGHQVGSHYMWNQLFWSRKAAIGPGLFLLAQAEAIRHPNDHKSHQHQHHTTTSVPNFTRRPKPVIRVAEGARVELPCAVDRKLDTQRWRKRPLDGAPDDILELFESGKREASVSSRFQFIGDPQAFDHSIAIQAVQLSDSGQYVCEMLPETLEKADQLDQFRVTTNLTVLAAPPPAPPQTMVLAVSSSAGAHQSQPDEAQARAEHQHQQQPRPASERHRSQVRDISPTWTRLSSSNNNFISNSMQQPSTNHLGSGAGPVLATWPFMLLGLAGLLMLVNIYLIYKLIKRYNSRGAASPSSCCSS